MRASYALSFVFWLGCSNATNAPSGVASAAGGAGAAAGAAAMAGGANADGSAAAGVGGAAAGVAGVGGASGGGANPGLGAGAGAGGGESTAVAGRGGANTAGAAGIGGDSSKPLTPRASGLLCVFDYDLTLSTNNCIKEQYACRTNTCLTYNWYQQCMSDGARHALEVCVERGAYIGIASHASVDGCWDDKVSVVITQQQFPALTSAIRYDNATTDFAYPKIDQRSNWNCDNCAYHMNGAFSKPQLISKIMTHYEMDPKNLADRAKVIFWDDLPDNISKMKQDMPEVHTIHVHENIDGQPNSGGCGIQQADIDAGWASFPK
jgi:hypothetical protein